MLLAVQYSQSIEVKKGLAVHIYPWSTASPKFLFEKLFRVMSLYAKHFKKCNTIYLKKLSV
jgi:hypothetical protein